MENSAVGLSQSDMNAFSLSELSGASSLAPSSPVHASHSRSPSACPSPLSPSACPSPLSPSACLSPLVRSDPPSPSPPPPPPPPPTPPPVQRTSVHTFQVPSQEITVEKQSSSLPLPRTPPTQIRTSSATLPAADYITIEVLEYGTTSTSAQTAERRTSAGKKKVSAKQTSILRTVPVKKKKKTTDVHLVSATYDARNAHQYIGRKSFKLDDDFLLQVLVEGMYVLRVTRAKTKSSSKCSYYAAFATVDLLCTYYRCYDKQLKESLCAMDEVCISYAQKPKIDFDGKRCDFAGVSDDYSTGDHVQAIKDVLKCFAFAISSLYKIDAKEVKRGINVYSSCRNDKISFHLICTTLCCSLEDCRTIALKTCHIIRQYCKKDYSNSIDQQVYRPKQCFRVLGSCKFNEMSLRLPVKTQCRIVDNKLVPTQNDDESEQEPLLQSLVSWVDDLPYRTKDLEDLILGKYAREKENRVLVHQILNPPQSSSTTPSGSLFATESLSSLLQSEAQVLYNAQFVCRTVPHVDFRADALVYLDRKSKGFCVQCKVEHERENIKAILNYVPVAMKTRMRRSSSSSLQDTQVSSSSVSGEYKLSYVCMRYAKKESFRLKLARRISYNEKDKWHFL